MKVPVHTLNLQPVFPDGLKIGATSDEKYVVSCRSHTCTEVPAECTGRHHGNAHVCTEPICLGACGTLTCDPFGNEGPPWTLQQQYAPTHSAVQNELQGAFDRTVGF